MNSEKEKLKSALEHYRQVKQDKIVGILAFVSSVAFMSVMIIAIFGITEIFNGTADSWFTSGFATFNSLLNIDSLKKLSMEDKILAVITAFIPILAVIIYKVENEEALGYLLWIVFAIGSIAGISYYGWTFIFDFIVRAMSFYLGVLLLPLLWLIGVTMIIFAPNIAIIALIIIGIIGIFIIGILLSIINFILRVNIRLDGMIMLLGILYLYTSITLAIIGIVASYIPSSCLFIPVPFWQ